MNSSKLSSLAEPGLGAPMNSYIEGALCKLIYRYIDRIDAFDMVDHEILLQRLQLSCGISNSPLLGFKSYLSDRSQMIILDDSRSKWARVRLGIPQGSVLGPILYILYTADNPLVIANHDATGQCVIRDMTFLKPFPFVISGGVFMQK